MALPFSAFSERPFADADQVTTPASGTWGGDAWGDGGWGGAIGVAVDVTGVAATSALGNETVATTENVSFSITGEEATGSVGNETVATTENISFSITGQQATGSVGNETITGTSSTTATGAEGTGIAGSLIISGAAVTGVSGLASTSGLGDESVIGDANFSVSGEEATTNLGNETVLATENVSFSVTGEEATGSVGNETVTAGSLISVTGIEAKNNFNPEFGLTLDNTFGVRTAITSNFGSTNSTFAGEAQLPSSFSGGAECLFDMGGAFHGTFLGIAKISNVYNLRYRAGDGQNTVQTATANNALKNVPISELSQFFNGGVHTLVWDVKPSSQGRIRLFIDGQLIIDESTSAALGANGAGVFAGGNEGGWGQGFGNSVAGGQVDTNLQNLTAWSGTITNGLRHYQDELIDVPSVSVATTVGVSVTLSGEEATTSLGNETILLETPVSVTGVEAQADPGSVTPTTILNANVVAQGEEATGEFNNSVTIVAIRNIAFTISGVSNTSTSIGDETVIGDSVFPLVEQDTVEATAIAGSLIISGAAVTGVSGELTTLNLGEEDAVTGTANVVISTGFEVTGEISSVTLESKYDVNGTEATGSTDDVVVLGNSIHTVSGEEAQSELGDEDTVIGSAVFSVSGEEAQSELNDEDIVTGDSIHTVSGEEAQSELSDLTTIAISVSTVVSNPSELTSTLNDEDAVTGSAVFSVSGEEAQSTLGDEEAVVGDCIITLTTGFEANISLENVTIETVTIVSVTGNEITTEFNNNVTIITTSSVVVSIIGLSSQGNIGIVNIWGRIVPDQNANYSAISPSQTPSWSEETVSQTPSWSETSASQSPSWSEDEPSQDPNWTEEAA